MQAQFGGAAAGNQAQAVVNTGAANTAYNTAAASNDPVAIAESLGIHYEHYNVASSPRNAARPAASCAATDVFCQLYKVSCHYSHSHGVAGLVVLTIVIFFFGPVMLLMLLNRLDTWQVLDLRPTERLHRPRVPVEQYLSDLRPNCRHQQ